MSRKQKDTWQSIGGVARILAGKLVVARELEKMAAASALEGCSGDGQVGLRGDAAEGKSALRGQGEERTRRASANRGDGALIVGTEAHHEFGLEIAPSRRDPTARQSAPVMRAVGET